MQMSVILKLSPFGKGGPGGDNPKIKWKIDIKLAIDQREYMRRITNRQPPARDYWVEFKLL
jgi:hypothetical protein